MDDLSIWVVYDHPSDWPDYYVARRHVAYGPDEGPTLDMILEKDLERLRVSLERKGLVHLARIEGDDPVILETWL